MKKIIILLLFLLNIFIVFANDKIDYSKYYLQGFFKLGECFLNEKKEETCEKQYFNIYDNKIVIISKINKQENYKAIKNDKYELITNEGSKIKIEVKDSYIEKFDLLSDKLSFKRSEKEMINYYSCEKAFFYFLFYHKTNNIKKIGTVEQNIDLEWENFKNKNFFILKNKENIFFVLTNENNFPYIINNGSEYYFKINNKKIIYSTKDDYDLKIENCVITYYNKDKEIFTEK